jgi:hypothetical protein
MSSAREPDPTPEEDQAVTPVEPADWVKPVELIELLQRRTEKHKKQPKAPTSSPFYDSEFVASHRRRRKRRAD